jgi:adenylate cyclase
MPTDATSSTETADLLQTESCQLRSCTIGSNDGTRTDEAPVVCQPDAIAVLSYEPEGKAVEVAPGATILETSLAAGIPLSNECGGNGRCSTCRVRIVEGLEYCSEPSTAEAALAAQIGLEPCTRLACQTTVSGNVKLRRLVLDWEQETLSSVALSETDPCPTCGEKTLAILFSDIRGFTAFSEKLPPYDVVHILNRYFHHMGGAITQHGGFIANYMGDGLLAVFGLDDAPDPALRAAKAGLEMLQIVERLRPYFEAHHGHSFDIGVGAHFGEVVVGNVGFDNQKKLTVIGDSVNFASRIESKNKELRTRFLISDELFRATGDALQVRTLEPMEFKGKSGGHLLHEVLGARGH